MDFFHLCGLPCSVPRREVYCFNWTPRDLPVSFSFLSFAHSSHPREGPDRLASGGDWPWGWQAKLGGPLALSSIH